MVAACQTTSPTPAPAGPFAVMVHMQGPGEPYYVQLVGLDARGGPWARAVTRSSKTLFVKRPCQAGSACDVAETAPYWLPETSVSSTKVYFLDGDDRVMVMGLDGKISQAKDIGAAPNSQVMFSVSPDDSRIAVSVITLATSFQAPAPFDDTVYVEDLHGGKRSVLYHSTRIAEWPVGWKDHNVIVAVGGGDLAVDSNPYGAVGYRVVDAATGDVNANLDCHQGLVVAAGTACTTGLCSLPTQCEPGRLAMQDWYQAKTDFAVPATAQNIFVPYTQLSPAGDRIAVALVTDPQTGALETAVLSKDGTVHYTSLTGAPQGWLDETHLVLGSIDGVWIADITSSKVDLVRDLQRIPQSGQPQLAATVPPSL